MKYTDEELALLATVASKNQRWIIESMRLSLMASRLISEIKECGDDGLRLTSTVEWSSSVNKIQHGRKRLQAILEASGVAITGGKGRTSPKMAKIVGEEE